MFKWERMVGRGGCSILFVSAALVCLALHAPAHAADASPSDEARAFHERATAAFALGHYAAAAEWFEKAFDRKPDPAELYNAAQAQRLAGNRERALLLYRNYLRVFPKAGRRGEVEARVQELAQALEQNKKSPVAASAPPVAPAPAVVPPPVVTAPPLVAAPPAAAPAAAEIPAAPPARVEPAIAPPPAPAPSAERAPWAPRPIPAPSRSVAPPPAGPPLLVTDAALPAADASPPLTHRAWFWVLIGIGVAAAGGAAVIVASSGDKRPKPSLGVFP